MAKINYDLSKKIKDGQSEIILDIQPQRGQHYRVKTGIYITPANYDRLTATNKITSYDVLYNIEKELYSAMPCDKQTVEDIIKRCKGEDDRLLSVFDAYTNDRMIERGLTDGTKELYMCLRAAITGYDELVSLKAINHKWLSGFIQYMCVEEMSNVTQRNYWRVLKTFLTHCVGKNMLDPQILTYKPQFRIVDNDVVSLTAEELQAMYVVELNKRECEVRDVFVIQCLTGLRHSDMHNIYKENIQEDEGGKYITLVTKKTFKRLKIYFNDRAEHILNIYDYTLPRLSRGIMNSHLPNIAKKAGVKGRIERVSMIGSKRIVEYKEKWEVIKTHTARRTFITLMLESGENITTIRSITGHSQLSSFARYAGVSDKKKSTAVKGLDW